MPTRYDISMIVGIDVLTIGAFALLFGLTFRARRIWKAAHRGQITMPAFTSVGLLMLAFMMAKAPMSSSQGRHWWDHSILDGWDLNLTLALTLYPFIVMLVAVAFAVSLLPVIVAALHWLDDTRSSTCPELTNRQDLQRRYRMARTEAALARALSRFLPVGDTGRPVGTVSWDRLIQPDSATTWFTATPEPGDLTEAHASLLAQFASIPRISAITVESSSDTGPRIRLDWNLAALDARRHEPHAQVTVGQPPLRRLLDMLTGAPRPVSGH